MKQILGFIFIMVTVFSLEAKKTSAKKENIIDTNSYIIIKDHRAPGVHKKAQRGIAERNKQAQKKIHHVRKAHEVYYKKHKKSSTRTYSKNKK